MKLWAALLEEEAPATPKEVEYGTPKWLMRFEVFSTSTDVRRRKIFAMAGHEGGVVAFGRDLGEAFRVLRSKAKDAPTASQGSQKTQISAGHDRIGDSRLGDEEHTNAQCRMSNVQPQ